MSVFELRQAHSPLVISVPHDGALIPDEIQARMNPAVMDSTDRDLLISEVFDFATPECSVIKASHSRHVIDLNRPPDGQALYQNQQETQLCPTSTFDWKPVYLSGQEPDAAEIRQRTMAYWQPYHDQLQALIDEAVAAFGHCLLIDAHSIDAQVPRFFSGILPDINVGTNQGVSCAPDLASCLMNCLSAQTEFSVVNNGRFKGGYITRHYGQPDRGVHAIQLEHNKNAYLNKQQKLSPRGVKLQHFWQQTLAKLIKRL